MSEIVVEASDVEEGDFLTALDNGYVFEVEEESEFYTRINFHDCDGEECYLIVPNETNVSVRRA